MKTQRIGMLGAGNMASALVRGLLASKSLEPTQVGASDIHTERLTALEAEHGIVTFASNAELVKWATMVVLAVKPQVVDRVLAEIRDVLSPSTLLVSIAAGVPLELIQARVAEGVPVVRAMPNTAAIALAGATAISPGAHATAEHLAAAKQLFDAVGKTAVLDESLLDAVTGLSGSGPAYIMLIIEALADGGVRQGLHRDTALMLAAQTVYGSAKLQLESGEHPGRLKDMVTSPGGTAIAGLHTLESGGLRRTLIDAVATATERAGQLGDALVAKLRQK